MLKKSSSILLIDYKPRITRFSRLYTYFMDNELVISATSEEEVRIALLGDDRLIELHKENPESNEFSVGDVYLGKVRKLAVGLMQLLYMLDMRKMGSCIILTWGLNF